MGADNHKGEPASAAATAPPRAKKKVQGVVYISANRCKGCGFCIAFCPQHVLAFSGDFNTHGYHPPHLTHAAGCTGCDLCGLYCPDFAIYAVMVKSEAPPKPAPQAEEASHEG